MVGPFVISDEGLGSDLVVGSRVGPDVGAASEPSVGGGVDPGGDSEIGPCVES